LTIVLDTRVLVALCIDDAHSSAARTGIVGQSVIVSDFAMGEFASAMSRLVRVGDMLPKPAQSLIETFSAWTHNNTTRVLLDASDIETATAFVMRYELGLRMPDAVHIALARRVGAAPFTFDETQSAAAIALGVETVPS
jgi:hypothetical protein